MMTYLLESVTHRQSKEGIFLKEISKRGEEGISPRDLISLKEKRIHRKNMGAEKEFFSCA
jgi:hypothetical protein